LSSSETAENYIHVFGSSNHQDSPLDFSEYQERSHKQERVFGMTVPPENIDSRPVLLGSANVYTKRFSANLFLRAGQADIKSINAGSQRLWS
jgi:hypothetical protein